MAPGASMAPGTSDRVTVPPRLWNGTVSLQGASRPPGGAIDGAGDTGLGVTEYTPAYSGGDTTRSVTRKGTYLAPSEPGKPMYCNCSVRAGRMTRARRRKCVCWRTGGAGTRFRGPAAGKARQWRGRSWSGAGVSAKISLVRPIDVHPSRFTATCGGPASPPATDPPPPSRTKWTRRVPHPVLIGHAAY